MLYRLEANQHSNQKKPLHLLTLETASQRHRRHTHAQVTLILTSQLLNGAITDAASVLQLLQHLMYNHVPIDAGTYGTHRPHT